MSPDASQKSQRIEKALETLPLETEALVEILLNHALEAEANFLSLYDVAIQKATATDVKDKLTEFRSDHERHVEEIVGTLEQLEGAVLVARREPTPLALALAERLQAADGDDALLMEFAASEDLSRHLYSWLGSVPAPEPVARIAQRGLQDEERHYAWAAKQLGLSDEAD